MTESELSSILPLQDDETPLCVLVVDDNSNNLRVLYETLDGGGFDIRVADSGPSALEAAKAVSPELVLLDIAMPGMDGFEVCRRLKADAALSSAAIIFLSAYDDTEARVRGLNLGAVDFISKPFQPEEVLARVRTHLRIQQLQQQLSRRNEQLEAAYNQLETINRKMKEDLVAAANVQQSLLPSAKPDCARAEFAWEYVPCEELAGDFLNVLPLSGSQVGVYVADVSGHGVASALLSVTIARMLTPQVSASSLLVRFGPEQEATVVSPSDVAAELNRRFPMEAQNGLYFTIVYGVLDLDSLKFRFVSAGHDPVVRKTQDASPTLLSCNGSPVGWFEDVDYEELSVQLEPGDRLYLYSDGVHEATNEQHGQFSRKRMLETIESEASASLEESVASLAKAVESWCPEGPQDDVSILGLEIP